MSVTDITSKAIYAQQLDAFDFSKVDLVPEKYTFMDEATGQQQTGQRFNVNARGGLVYKPQGANSTPRELLVYCPGMLKAYVFGKTVDGGFGGQKKYTGEYFIVIQRHADLSIEEEDAKKNEHLAPFLASLKEAENRNATFCENLRNHIMRKMVEKSYLPNTRPDYLNDARAMEFIDKQMGHFWSYPQKENENGVKVPDTTQEPSIYADLFGSAASKSRGKTGGVGRGKAPQQGYQQPVQQGYQPQFQPVQQGYQQFQPQQGYQQPVQGYQQFQPVQQGYQQPMQQFQPQQPAPMTTFGANARAPSTDDSTGLPGEVWCKAHDLGNNNKLTNPKTLVGKHIYILPFIQVSYVTDKKFNIKSVIRYFQFKLAKSPSRDSAPKIPMNIMSNVYDMMSRVSLPTEDESTGDDSRYGNHGALPATGGSGDSELDELARLSAQPHQPQAPAVTYRAPVQTPQAMYQPPTQGLGAIENQISSMTLGGSPVQQQYQAPYPTASTTPLTPTYPSSPTSK